MLLMFASIVENNSSSCASCKGMGKSGWERGEGRECWKGKLPPECRNGEGETGRKLENEEREEWVKKRGSESVMEWGKGHCQRVCREGEGEAEETRE